VTSAPVPSDRGRTVRRMNLLAMTKHMGVRYEELGFLLAGAGGVMIAFGNMMPLGRRSGSMLGGLLLAVGMVLAIVGVHYGRLG
jgi:vacuolar-type H+-ATPase subunit I/STV1